LLYQLRVKVKAQEAGVESVSMENRNLVLRLYLPQGLEPAEVPEGMRYSRAALYIPAAVPATEWKPTLTRALEWVRRWKISAAPPGG
jgi:hypothetical protein